jgi:uncharacterized protein YaeQ
MAQGDLLHRFEISLADVDRGRYAELDLRVARHPSESAAFLLARVLAYCLEHEDGIAFSSGGVSSDEPALCVRGPDGALRAWIEVGWPSPERLHRAAKSAPRVAVYAHEDPDRLVARCEGERIHRAGEILVRGFERGFLGGLERALARRVRWQVSVLERSVFVAAGETSLASAVVERRLA